MSYLHHIKRANITSYAANAPTVGVAPLQTISEVLVDLYITEDGVYEGRLHYDFDFNLAYDPSTTYYAIIYNGINLTQQFVTPAQFDLSFEMNLVEGNSVQIILEANGLSRVGDYGATLELKEEAE